MSQMILFTYKKPNNLFFGIENNLYFKEYAKVLFHTNCTDGIYTIPNFDSLCVCAQKSIGNGISINQTELFKVLQWIQNEEIYMWYGAECDDLDCIENLIEANSIRMDSAKNKERRRECQRIAFLKLKLLGYISFLALENQCILKKQYQQISLQLSDCISLLVAWRKSDAERK